jgi:hypothetical protein
MWRFFAGKRSEQDFAAEAEQVAAECEVIVKLRQSLYPQNKDDSKQMLKWYGGRIPVLENKHYHPVAKLSFSERYDEMVEDYVKKLGQAAAGDRAARAEVKEIRAKAVGLVAEELDYLKFKKAKWEDIGEKAREFVADKDWKHEKLKINAQLVEERALIAAAVPKNKEDMTQWGSYYRQRLSRLELPKKVLPLVAKIPWVLSLKREERERKIQEYLGLLDRLIAGENLVDLLLKLENDIEILVINEALRLRRDYARFLQKPGNAVA